jgi:FMN phosphatase YigB (HAD superfamily)/DNA-binding XRE family transcriptional regulator
MAMDEVGLGKRLQSVRQANKLTQQGLCQKANISYSTLAKIERGAIKAPSIFTIQSIAQALNIGLDDLLQTGAGSNKPKRNLKHTRSGASFIYFDVNGCLIRYYERAFAKIAVEYDVAPDVVESAYWHYNDAACRGELTLEDFNKTMAERIGATKFDWAPYYWEAAEAVTDMHKLVSWAAEHYQVGLLTNIISGLLRGLQQNGKVPALPYDAIVDSSVVGAIKPEAKMFELATVAAGVPPEQIMLVDDTRANLKAAEAQGWHVMLFDYARPDESADLLRAALQPVD